jgi:hypothetical protein
MTKKCSRCGQSKSLDEFKSDSRKPCGKASSCKSCNSAPKVGDLPIVNSRALVPVFDLLDPQVWATRISERWRASIEAIIDVGRLLGEAKVSLPHGAFGSMIENDLPFSASTAQRLMAIARDPRLSNPAHVQLLPASWGTLYELTKLSDEEFAEAIENNIIRPDMLRGEAELIRPLIHLQNEESPAKATEGKAGMAVVEDHVRRSTAGTGLRVGEAGAVQPATSEIMDATAGETAPNSTPTPSGGLAIAHQRIEPVDSLDFFPTPPWATRAFVEHVLTHLDRRGHCQFQTVWEPACGEGHMAEPLKEYFREVQATDIADYGYGIHGVDFLDDHPPMAIDWIITNPPFNTSADFVLKALQFAGTGVAMFVRLTWLESVGRYERIFRDHPPTLLAIFSERVPLHKGRWEDEGTTMTAYIWMVWIKGADPRAPFWIPPGCRETLTKPDDAKRFGKSAAFELPPHDPETGEIREGEAA